MAKNFKNLNSKEKYEFLYDTYKKCDCCGQTKTYNSFFDRSTNKLGKICRPCCNRIAKKAQEKEIFDIVLGVIKKDEKL